MPKSLLRILLALGPFTLAQADEHLQVDQYSDQHLSGTYYQNEHTLTFHSTLVDQVQVYFSLAIDGRSLIGQYDFGQKQTELWIGEGALEDKEQALLKDAAEALSEYVQADERNIPAHAVILVGALDYWPDLFE